MQDARRIGETKSHSGLQQMRKTVGRWGDRDQPNDATNKTQRSTHTTTIIAPSLFPPSSSCSSHAQRTAAAGYCETKR